MFCKKLTERFTPSFNRANHVFSCYGIHVSCGPSARRAMPVAFRPNEVSDRESKASQRTYTEFGDAADFPVRSEPNVRPESSRVAIIVTRGSCQTHAALTGGIMCGLRGPGADLIAGLFGECPRGTDRILPFLADADCRLLLF